MSDEHIKQRIAYLVQHGGLYEDPTAEIRTELRRLRWVVGVGGFGLSALVVLLMLLR
jgi:hypothetical protein